MLETEVFDIEPDITVVSCAGRFTLGTQLRLTESMVNTLIQKGARKLVVDLTHTEIVDSAGLGVLMHVFGELEQIGGTMRVAGANDRVANLFCGHSYEWDSHPGPRLDDKREETERLRRSELMGSSVDL